MIETTLNCLTNEWCSAMGPHSFCNSTSNTCQCSSIAKFNETSYYCDLVSTESGKFSYHKYIFDKKYRHLFIFLVTCLKDIDCNINERCLDEECVCSEKFLRNNDNVCIPSK